MANSLFVGGFPYETSQEELARVFSACGKVTGVKILMDRATGRSRGIGFVDMATEAEAREAISRLNGSTLGARKIFVNEARPQEKRPAGFAKPGFVERRSGADRRSAASPAKKPWGEKPSFGGEKKKFWGAKASFVGKKKSWGDKPKGTPGGKKKWSPGGPGKSKRFGGQPF